MSTEINECFYKDDKMTVTFEGWTDYHNPNFKDFTDEIDESSDWRGDPNTTFTIPETGETFCFKRRFPKEGRVSYIEFITNAMEKAELILKNRCMVKGIKFDGNYHQNGEFGVPLFNIKSETINKTLKWTATFRYWGSIMEEAGHAVWYGAWAWNNAEDPVYPDEVVGEKCIPF